MDWHGPISVGPLCVQEVVIDVGGNLVVMATDVVDGMGSGVVGQESGRGTTHPNFSSKTSLFGQICGQERNNKSILYYYSNLSSSWSIIINGQ